MHALLSQAAADLPETNVSEGKQAVLSAGPAWTALLALSPCERAAFADPADKPATPSEEAAWWEVDLEQLHTLTRITLCTPHDVPLAGYQVQLRDSDGCPLAAGGFTLPASCDSFFELPLNAVPSEAHDAEGKEREEEESGAGGLVRFVRILAPPAQRLVLQHVAVWGRPQWVPADLYAAGELGGTADDEPGKEEEADGSGGAGALCDLAVHGVAEQSSLAWGGLPERAINGSTDGVWAHGGVTHTDCPPAGARNGEWWQLDLGRLCHVSSVAIHNRVECSDRLRRYDLLLSSQPFPRAVRDLYDYDKDVKAHADVVRESAGNQQVYRFDGIDARVRYVRVQSLVTTEPLSLAAVQVLGHSSPFHVSEAVASRMRVALDDDRPSVAQRAAVRVLSLALAQGILPASVCDDKLLPSLTGLLLRLATAVGKPGEAARLAESTMRDAISLLPHLLSPGSRHSQPAVDVLAAVLLKNCSLAVADSVLLTLQAADVQPSSPPGEASLYLLSEFSRRGSRAAAALLSRYYDADPATAGLRFLLQEEADRAAAIGLHRPQLQDACCTSLVLQLPGCAVLAAVRPLQQLTVECWLRLLCPAAEQAEAPLLAIHHSQDGGGDREESKETATGLCLRAGQLVAVAPGMAPLVCGDGEALLGGSWHHIALVCDELQLSVYLDGAPLAATAAAAGGSTAGQLRLSGFALFSEARLWHVARSASCIADAARRRVFAHEDGLLALWRLAGSLADSGWQQLHGSARDALWLADAPALPVVAPASPAVELPLVEACEQGRAVVVSALLLAGEDMNAQREDGLTPLSAASRNGHLPVVKQLLAAGAAVSAADGTGLAACHAASRSGHAAVVSTLVAAGADVDSISAAGSDRGTALYYAAAAGQLAAIEALLAAHADINLAAASGDTALHAACCGCHVVAVQKLLRAGADWTATNRQGQTAQTVARAAGAAACAALIERHAQLKLPEPMQAVRRAVEAAVRDFDVAVAAAAARRAEEAAAVLASCRLASDVVVQRLLQEDEARLVGDPAVRAAKQAVVAAVQALRRAVDADVDLSHASVHATRAETHVGMLARATALTRQVADMIRAPGHGLLEGGALHAEQAAASQSLALCADAAAALASTRQAVSEAQQDVAVLEELAGKGDADGVAALPIAAHSLHAAKKQLARCVLTLHSRKDSAAVAEHALQAAHGGLLRSCLRELRGALAAARHEDASAHCVLAAIAARWSQLLLELGGEVDGGAEESKEEDNNEMM